MASKRGPDLETQLKDIRKQLNDQLGCLDFRMESKLSLLSEYQEFFKRRGEVEYEYARNLERLCERFEKNTKQRNIKNEVRSTFNLWSTLLAETRKVSRERANLAEVLATEMASRLDIMAKDVNILTKKCKEICIEIQDQFLKELRDLSEQTKVYQHSCHNTMEAHNKLMKMKEKQGTGRKKKGKDKEVERQRQLKVQQHLLMKNRNDYLLGISRCNALSMQYFNMDIMDVIEYMDFDYHNSFQRLANAYREAEKETCEAMIVSADAWADQSGTLNFESDLHYFLSEYSQPFTPPVQFGFAPFEADDVCVFKVNTEDVYKRARKTVVDLHEEVQTLQIQSEEDVKTIAHMKQVNLHKYQITTVDDALAVIEENGDPLPLDSSRDRGNASLERGLSLNSRGGQAIQLSQKGKRDTLFFTLGILQRRIQRADRLCLATSQLDILEKSLEEQKVPPVPVGVDAQGRHIPGEVPKLFGGDVVDYIMATGLDIPLIITSCCQSIEREGIKMEGLFRVPGPAAYTEELRKGFEEGRDPLAYTQGKIDIAAVASTLKAYFRELSTPLFPTDKYREFTDCARQDDYQSRLDAVKTTVMTLHPAVITVMRYLFRFLFGVSRYATDNKMGTANLALVFGPTLTRAPDSVDPRQLHNDVPAVNVLIQMCIEKYEYIFGEDEEEVLSPNTVDSLGTSLIEEPPMSTSPPSEPPDTPQQVIEQQFSDEEQFPPPPLPPRTESTPIRETTPPFVPREKSPSPFPQPSSSELAKEPSPSPVETPQVAAQVGVSDELIEQPSQHEPTLPIATPPPENEAVQQPPSEETVEEPLADELSNLDAAMMEIEASLHDMGEKEEQAPPPTTEEGPCDELSDEDSESEDEEGVLKIEAVALHDYMARSDKELSFKRGESLQVIEKTPDHNWWDGFHNGKRGFIPVAYIEILELNKPVPASPLPVPPPRAPARKSSMPPEIEEVSVETTKVPSEATIIEERETEVLPAAAQTEGEREIKTPDVKIDSPEPEPIKVDETPPPTVQQLETKSPELKKPATPRSSGSVKAITSKFQTHEVQQQQQPRVLVEPRHRRQHSDQFRKPLTENENVSQRSLSGSSKVGMISSQFETKAAAPPPPIKPKPHHLQHFPTSPSEPPSPGAFPIMSHPKSGSLPSASPLQQIALQSQVSQKPAQLRKPASSKTGKAGSFKVKKDKGKSDDKAITKPLPPAKPVPPPGIGSLRDKTAELNAEFQAKALARRRHAEEGPK